jgi:hypothetical protein
MVSSTKQRIRKKLWNKLWEEEREMFQGPKGSFVSKVVTRHMRMYNPPVGFRQTGINGPKALEIGDNLGGVSQIAE